MRQDRHGRDQDARFSRERAAWLATLLEAERVPDREGVYRLGPTRVAIVCLRLGLDELDLPADMLAHADKVLAAFQSDDGPFDLYLLSAAQCRRLLARAQAPGANQLRAVLFRAEGRFLGRLSF